nr:retrotransposable element Tf2 [Tanacetum cinerariifolium]GFA96258.1 retrotransposable element Tf2 [Tanacetum cinerariifolium]
MTGEKPKEWMKWLSLAEFWYNSNFYNSIKTTPFEVVYGQLAPIHIPYTPKDSSVELVDRTLQAREQNIALLKFNLKATQDKMKSYADKKSSDREFEVGNFVYLKLLPYRQLTIRVNKKQKLSAMFYGSCKVLERIGKVAYRMELPHTTQVHQFFMFHSLRNVIPQKLL